MSSSTYGAIKLATAEEVGTILKKKMGTQTGYKPKDWADTINLLGKLPIRTASGSIAHFEDGADDVPMKSVVANITPIQEGTGTPSPSNPRPISGTSVLNVEQRGKNLFDPSTVFSNQGAYICAQGIFPRNTTLNMSLVDKDPSVSISGLYFGFVDEEYVSGSPSGHYRWVIDNGIINENKTNIAAATQNLCNGLIAFPQNQSTIDTILSRFDIQVELSTTPSAYEAYTGSTYTINLGRTVYGGSAEVVEGSGSVEKVLDTIVDSGWSKYSNFFYRSYSDKKRTTTDDEYPLLCSMVKNGGTITSSTSFRDGFIYQNALNDNIYIVDSSVTSIDDFYVKYRGCQICYELATPTDFTFTGQEINSLEGVNNVWHDGNGDSEVEYRADIDILINELGG